MEVAAGQTRTNAALSSFDCSTRASAKAYGSELMKRDDINEAVSKLMHEEGLDKRYRVRKLKGHVDNTDPTVSLRALDQSWKLDGSYAPQKVEIDMHAIHATVAAIRELEAGKPDREGET